MLVLPAGLLDSFTRLDVSDPAEMDVNSRITGRFPSYNNANTYSLRNRGLSGWRGPGVLSSFAMRTEGDLLFGHVQDRLGTEVGIVGAGFSRYCITTMLAGSLQRVDGTAVVADAENGLIYRGDPGLQLLGSDNNARFTVWIDAARLERSLEQRLDAPLLRPLEFAPVINWQAPHAAPLGRLVAFMAAELAQGDCLVSEPVARETLTDLFAQTILNRVPHSYSGRLAGPVATAVPRHLRRAEALMQAAAAKPIRISDIAKAAGCSTGTLYAAFRQYRGSTPLAALHDIRLHAIRSALLAPNEDSTGAIARRFGFTNLSRFTTAYGRRFGEKPAETRLRSNTLKHDIHRTSG